MNNLSKITVIGGGSWGTALASLLAGKGYQVALLVRNQELACAINNQHENVRYLPGLKLPVNISAYTSPQAALQGANVLLWAIPCQSSRKVLRELKPHLPVNPIIVSATKGIEVEHLKTVEEIVLEEISDLNPCYSALSGPSFAKEVVQQMPTAVVLACRNVELGCSLQEVFSTKYFRTYSSRDVTGVELGGAVKNVIAIAAGMTDGLGFGHNTKAALITRGLAEICRLGVALGADVQTFMGLSGMGDLVLTCTGELSRNRHVGICLGQGQNLDTIIKEMHMVAEGVRTAVAVNGLAAEKGVDMPITNAVCAVLDGSVKPKEAVHLLMTRTLKME